MRQLRFLLLLAIIALSLSAAGVAAAKPGRPHGNGNKPPQARITWSVSRVEQSVAPGETAQLSVTLTSSADLSNVTIAAPGGLGKVLTMTPATLGSLNAGVPVNVTFTMTMPSTNAHCQAGVVKLRAGNRSVPAPLNVKVLVAGDSGCGA